MAFIAWNNTSYDTARADILARAAQGLGYDFDGYYGYQCWDLGANWYAQIGMSFRTKNSYTGAGGEDSYVSTTWTYQPAFQNNSTDPYEAITDINQIKRGDMIIWAAGTVADTGHNAFADEDYNNGKSTISVLGQNQGAGSGAAGKPPSINEFPKAGILGAFRYKPWEGTGPTPPTPTPPSGAVLHPRGSNIVILHRAMMNRNRLHYLQT